MVRYLKRASGRKRFNVLSALHAISHELVILTNHETINALSVCELLVHLAHRFGDSPIVVILDNARYQKCTLVLDTARYLNIQLVFLLNPTAQPQPD
ncbi:MAG: transposase [Anaerolineales bacterium]|nr:transposase [Anaerolineales bacterium]